MSGDDKNRNKSGCLAEKKTLATTSWSTISVGSLPMKEKSLVKREIVWRNVFLFALLHIGAVIGVYQMTYAKWQTVVWSLLCWMLTSLGVTAGAHRLWSHRSYKARWPFRAVLMLFNSMAFQNDIIEWSRDHRCHHKWTDTDADPHNINRGFFFSHVGWLLTRKHPKIKENGAKLDLSDLYADPVIVFQRKYYKLLVVLCCFVLPTWVAITFWMEHPWTAFTTAGLLRYCFSLHATWCVNSVAHTWGYRPYSINISPAESIVTTALTFGEGAHNYHHTFPQDYRASEDPVLGINFTKVFIDLFAKVGLAYDLKTVSDETIRRQIERQTVLHAKRK
ncbi:hypothetical protein AB6A40_003606 [Gnathostoma spinigerum]|uniref:Fatty acid desaturase domain-containing protein n=1 Tax=Gnathostoma spinigerum TaxID=75299 RepID=A0ABD6EK02_9BILA